MSTIVTRLGKGSPLTNAEMDDNLSNLNTDKYESGNDIVANDISSTGDLILSAAVTVAAAGTVQGDSTPLNKTYSIVTTATSNQGVQLPIAQVGLIYNVINTSGVIVKIYPNTGGTIDDGGANTPIDVKSNTSIKFIGTSATNWQALKGSGEYTYVRTNYLATAAQTTFAATYTVGYVDVYINGAKLIASDFTATNGTSVVLVTGAVLNDEVEIIAFETFNVANAIVAADLIDHLQTTDIGVTVVGPTTTQTLTNKTITGLKETSVAIGASNIDMALGNHFTKTISGTTTLTVSNVPTTGNFGSFILDLTNGGSATVNLWSGIKWVAGVAPTLTAAGRDSLGFYTVDGGTNWTGLVLGLDII